MYSDCVWPAGSADPRRTVSEMPNPAVSSTAASWGGSASSPAPSDWAPEAARRCTYSRAARSAKSMTAWLSSGSRLLIGAISGEGIRVYQRAPKWKKCSALAGLAVRSLRRTCRVASRRFRPCPRRPPANPKVAQGSPGPAGRPTARESVAGGARRVIRPEGRGPVPERSPQAVKSTAARPGGLHWRWQ